METEKGNGIRTIYLSGPIKDATDEEARAWRQHAAELWCAGAGMSVLAPMRKDWGGKLLERCNEVVEGDLDDIRRSDALLVYYSRPSVGTSMEIMYAKEMGKPVVIVNASGGPLSPWHYYHMDAVAPSVEKALLFLRWPSLRAKLPPYRKPRAS